MNRKSLAVSYRARTEKVVLLTVSLCWALIGRVQAQLTDNTTHFNWYPGYYVLSSSRTAAGKQKLLDDPLVAPFQGVQFRYHWADSELAPGDYSAGFGALDTDLAAVAAKGKKILVFLTYKKFDGTSAVPADLRTGPAPWCSGSYCGQFTVGSASVALLWNAAVEARLKAWISAMAAHLAESPYLANVAGIVFPETSVDTTDTTVLAGAGYDPYVYLQAIEDNLLAATTAAPKLIAFIYFEGGFVSMDGTSVKAGERIGDWMLLHSRTGAGTPDLKPKNPKSTNHPCANPKYQGRIPCDPAVEAPDYALTVTDSIEQSFTYALSPTPTGLFASFLTFAHQAGTGPNAFTFADVSNYIRTHPMPNTAVPTWTTVPADTTAPTISSVVSSNITDVSASIGWTTDKDSDSQVEYGFTTSLGTLSSLSSLTRSHSVSLSGLESGKTYYYRAISKDALGNVGLSTILTFSTTALADTTAPAPTNLIATAVSHAQINLSWTDNAIDEDLYTVERSPDDITWTVVTSSLPANSTSYSDAGLTRDSPYYYRVSATNSVGPSGYSNTASATTLSTTIYGSDNFSRTITDGWGSAVVGGPYTLSGGTSSHFSVNGSVGSIVVDTLGDRQAFLVNASQQDLTVTAKVSTDKLAEGGNQEPSVLLRRVDGNNFYSFEIGFTSAQGVQASILSKTGGSNALLNTVTTGLSHTAGAYFRVKAQAEGINPTTLRMKVWPDGTTEPASWDLIRTDSAAALQVTAPIALLAAVSDTTTNLPVTFSWDDLTVTDVPVLTLPDAPTGLSATAVSSSQIDLAWTDNSSNEDGFKIERSPDNTTFTQIAAVGPNVITYSDTGLTASIPYYYRVRANNTGGDSAYSNTANATTQGPPAAPTNLSATAGNAQVALSWTASSGATSYNVKRSTTSGGPYTAIVSPTTTGYTDTGVTNGTTYYYVVTAVNAGGESANSTQASATPQSPNLAPVVNAGPDQTITLPNTATLNGSVIDDGLPSNTLIITWSQVSGPGTVTFGNPNAAVTTASFSAAGSYVVRLTANDSALSSLDEATITANPQDLIFADGFESGNLSAWSSSNTDGGNLSVSAVSALIGGYGLQALINDNKAIYVTDDSPTAEPRYRARFYFDLNTIPMAAGNDHFIFQGLTSTGTVVLRVQFRFSGGQYQLRASLSNDSSSFTNTAWFTISDAPHAVELDWRASTAAGANNGGVTLWIDDVQKANLTTVDNDTRRIERIRLGAVAGIDNGTRGTYYFDAFESRRQTYIGPVAR